MASGSPKKRSKTDDATSEACPDFLLAALQGAHLRIVRGHGFFNCVPCDRILAGSLALSLLAATIILLVSLSAISSSFKIAKYYQDRKAEAKDLVGLLMLDRELGETVVKELGEQPEAKALLPAPELKVVVHLGQRTQMGRRVFWQTACGLRSDRTNFVHSDAHSEEFFGLAQWMTACETKTKKYRLILYFDN